MTKKLWGGRFKKGIDPLLKAFSYSLHIDKELLCAELCVNEAWAKMLAKKKIISSAESTKLVQGIRSLGKTLREKDLDQAQETYEDIHAFLQQSLEKKIGAVAKKLHTARSRNDLVVTSARIYLKDKVDILIKRTTLAQRALVKLAKKAGKHHIAGMTHLRMAQPILMAHHLLAYVEMLEEDKGRLQDAQKRIDVLALGSAALAGSSLPIDQKFLAKELGFSKIATNSMAATSDRAFMTEVISALAVLWMHLSRLSEDFILWNSEAFHYIELDDSFATGSSLMPQKKNPDVFELIRGRSGVIFGHLQAHLALQKGLPLAYNRDLQEDKPALFDCVQKTDLALELLAKTIESTKLQVESMEVSVVEDTLYATDLLEYLVRKDVPFSTAHETVGKVVAYAAEKHKELREISLAQWQKFSDHFEEDIFDLFDPDTSVQAKKTIGSTNPAKVAQEIKRWEQLLKTTKK